MDSTDQIQRFLQICRIAKTAKKTYSGHKKIKQMLDYRAQQVDRLLDATEIGERIITKNVRREDVRAIGKAAIKHAPKIYGIAAKHIREKRDAKT